MIFLLLLSSVMVGNALSQLQCPEGWSPYEPDGTCLMYIPESKTYQDSVEHCTNLGASLSRIQDVSKNDFVASIMEFPDEIIWLPIHDLDKDDVFTYDDGSPMGSYHDDWASNTNFYRDVNFYPNFVCLVRFDNQAGTMYWVNNNCDDTLRFVCEKAPVPGCHPKWALNDNKDGCMKVIKKKKRTFNGARTYCQRLGGDLATSVTSYSDMSLVMHQVKWTAQLWIGVHSPGQNGAFEYIDGSPLEGTGPFKKGRPNASNENHCVSMKRKKWLDKKCNRWLHFVCEKDVTYP